MVTHSTIIRPAIAMIELIFAIVIMGIVLMSAPMLISTSTQSTYTALQQEGINEAASRVHMIMGYAWDEKNTDDAFTPAIAHVSTTNAAFDMVTTTGRRVGIPIESKRSFIRSDGSEITASALQVDGAAADPLGNDDIDDFIGDISLVENQTATTDYVEKITVNINTTIAFSEDNVSGGYNQNTITYVPFVGAGGSSTNIKSIVVTLTSTDTTNAEVLEKTIVLRAFSSNIGGYTFKEKVF